MSATEFALSPLGFPSKGKLSASPTDEAKNISARFVAINIVPDMFTDGFKFFFYVFVAVS